MMLKMKGYMRPSFISFPPCRKKIARDWGRMGGVWFLFLGMNKLILLKNDWKSYKHINVQPLKALYRLQVIYKE